MILQKQYSLWKTINIIFVVLLVIAIGLFFFYENRIAAKDNEIKDKQGKVGELQGKLSEAEKQDNYRNFQMAKVIKSKENNTNYYSLYTYLKQVKEEIQKALTDANISSDKFSLTVDKSQINISTVIPNYNFLYEDKKGAGLIDEFKTKPFIKKIIMNSYKVEGWANDSTSDSEFDNKEGLSVDVKLETE